MSYYAKLTRLAVPVLLTQITSIGRVVFATFVIAKLGQIPLAAFAIAAGLIETTMLISMGILSATVIHLSHNKDSPEKMHESFQANMQLCSGLTILISGLFILFSIFPGMFHIKAALQGQLSEFILIYILGTIPFIFSTGLRFHLLGIAKPMFISFSNLIGFIICLFLTYTLCLGKLGLPQLGIDGFAIAAALSFWVTLALLAIYFYAKKLIPNFSLREILTKFNHQVIWEQIKLGLPISIFLASEVLFMTVILMFLQHYSNAYVGVFQAVTQVSFLFLMWPLSIGQALMVVLGHHRQASQHQRRIMFRQSQCLSLIGITALMAVLLIFWDDIFRHFIHSENLVHLSREFMLASIVYLIIENFKTNYFYLLRGLRDTFIPMLSQTGVYWLLGIPLICLATIFHSPPQILFWIFNLCIILIVALYALRSRNKLAQN